MKIKFYKMGFVLVLALAAARLNAGSDLSQLVVFPNPVRVYAGDTQATFNNISDQFRIRIYTVHGTLVREIYQMSTNQQFAWDLKNDSGNNVSSGVYVYLVTNDAGQKRTGKLVIIR